ncbi:MAG: TPM domain-containing protein [Clostridia bacterium]|nr:TPM domain-containing protein [Clostridia bacterium]
MKKNVCTLLLLLCMLVGCSFTVFADGNADYVVDNADLLTDAQEAALEEQLFALSESSNADIVILTVTSLDGKTSLEYADDYFDYNGYGRGENKTGMLLLYLPGVVGERDIALSTAGDLIKCVSDADSDFMIDTLIPDLMAEDYEAAFLSFVDFAVGETAEIGKMPTLPLIYIPGCLLFGFVVAFIILKMQTASLKSVRKENSARYYVDENSLNLTSRHDRFLYRNVSKRAKQTQSSSGGTSVRTGSSGASHGGTSRKF